MDSLDKKRELIRQTTRPVNVDAMRNLQSLDFQSIAADAHLNFEGYNPPTIELVIPTKPTPMQFRNEQLITLGRRDVETGFVPTIDFSDLHGQQLGVSRLHAQIELRHGKYYIKDLGSTNGTWINGKLLRPFEMYLLLGGEEIRLSHLWIRVR